MSVFIERAGPAMSVQDAGRAGELGLGLSRGGAADRIGWLEGVALLGQSLEAASIEMAGMGGRLRFEADTRFALSGAPMRAMLNGAPIEWRASHRARAGDVLDIGVASRGVYGYLALAGGVDAPVELGGRGYHVIAGLGAPLSGGESLRLLPDPAPEAAPLRLSSEPVSSAPIRVMEGPQTYLFSEETRAGFEATRFFKSPRANRQGVRLDHEGAPFATAGQLNLVSDFIAEGDIQMTGDGTPFVLLAECQSMGGYPRIGTVLPADLPRVAQADVGSVLSFRFVSVEEAEATWESDEAILSRLKKRLAPMVRDPRDMADLLSYELIDRPPGEVTD